MGLAAVADGKVRIRYASASDGDANGPANAIFVASSAISFPDGDASEGCIAATPPIQSDTNSAVVNHQFNRRSIFLALSKLANFNAVIPAPAR